MGRLTLNVLLSFAQFEREVIGERIRDKMAASRRRARFSEPDPNSKTTGTIHPPAVRYWNMARQRYYRP